MAIVVVNEAESGIVVFRQEAEGVFGEELAVGNAGGAGDGAEGGVVIVGGDAVLEGVVKNLGDILVAVVGVEEVEAPVLGAHDKRARGEGLGGIPHELGTNGVVVGGVQSLDAEEIVVDEAEVCGDTSGAGLLVLHAMSAAVDHCRNSNVFRSPPNRIVHGNSSSRN